MPTIIDSLLVTLGIDNSSFKKGKKQVDDGIKETRKAAEENFKAISKSALEFFGIIGSTYEIGKFVQNQIEANAALQRFALNLRETAQNISAWSNAAELAGGTSQGLQGTLDLLSRTQTEIKLTGQSALIPYLSALGVSLADVHGNALPVTKVLEEIGQSLMQRNGGNRQNAFNMGRMMGIDPGTLNLILKSRTEVELALKRQKEYNAVTNEEAEESLKLKTAMIGVQQSFEAFGRTLLQDASPALEKIFGLLSSFGEWLKNNKVFVEGFFGVIAAGVAAIGIAAIPISGTVAAITAVATVMGALWDDFQTWKAGGNSLFNWAPAVDLVTTAFERLEKVIESVLYRIGAYGAAVNAVLLHGDWAAAGADFKAMIKGPPDHPIDNLNARQKFIKIAASQLGVPEAAVDAQLRLETGGAGGSTIGKYNYGNIKAGKGYVGSTISKTVEERSAGGFPYSETSRFRSYGNPEDAAADYATMIRNKFPGAVGAQNAADYARGLQSGGYATDPNYVSKVSSIASGIPNASRAGFFSSPGNRPVAGAANNNSDNSTKTTIGTINIQTQATDADGMARDVAKSMDYLSTSQGNYGLAP